MMVQPQRSTPENFPKPPLKSYSSFETPKDLCQIINCYEFCLDCGLCSLHCNKIHNHKTFQSQEEINKLIDKYNKNRF